MTEAKSDIACPYGVPRKWGVRVATYCVTIDTVFTRIQFLIHCDQPVKHASLRRASLGVTLRKMEGRGNIESPGAGWSWFLVATLNL